MHCHNCKIFVAEIINGSQMRKGTVMLCASCISILESSVKSKQDGKGYDMPDFLKGLGDLGGMFGGKK